MRITTIDKYIDTMSAIAASPRVHEFMIGYTSRAGRARRGEYRYNHEYQHLVVIADRLTLKDAHRLEMELQEIVRQDRRSQLYRKYNMERRDGRYYASAGQAKADPIAPVHSVYMAWWEEE